MKRKLKIYFLLLGVIITTCIVWLELFHVVRDRSNIDDNLDIALEFRPDLFAWQDPWTAKKVTISNKSTGSTLQLNFESHEWNLYFYVDSNSTEKALRITDRFLGQNEYDYNLLKLSPNQKDCLQIDDYCGGFSIEALENLGKPILTFDNNGFSK